LDFVELYFSGSLSLWDLYLWILPVATVGVLDAITMSDNSDSPSYYSISHESSIRWVEKKSSKRLAEGVGGRNDFRAKCFRMNSIAELAWWTGGIGIGVKSLGRRR
jgi:hypothetical protein